ncbi:hypothetical protein WR25_11403 [Diploscapter pachys]|uniref:CID domain-containing protein n=1 Tax=Diploscapter pachys TaxID=2018661 RepID=A0A2A2L330_9BILA|nr:hypothetical protein WR25_11403 [Diploscapter pachys]
MGSTGFSEESLRGKLAKLTNQQDSIQTLTAWILHHHEHHQAIVQSWHKEVRKESSQHRIITLLYLANDVVQNCRKRYPNIRDSFGQSIESAMRHAFRIPGPELQRCMERLINIWKEREVFPPNILKRFEEAIGKRKPLPLNASLTPSTSKFPDSIKVISPADEYNWEAMANNANEVLESLRKLMDPASADGEIRHRISTYPEAIANPALLTDIRYEQQADALLEKNGEANPIVRDYCRRLGEEVLERRNLQKLLDSLLSNLRIAVDYQEKVLRDIKRKEDRLKKDREETQKAFDSLPDLNAEAPTNDMPLPSLERLFDLDVVAD